jgi:hypothetical protein
LELKVTKQDLNGTSRIARSGELLEAEVNGEIVALSIDKGQCYGMNDVASRAWTLLAEPSSVREICETLTSEYDIDLATCETQIIDLLRELREEGLIQVLPD